MTKFYTEEITLDIEIVDSVKALLTQEENRQRNLWNFCCNHYRIYNGIEGETPKCDTRLFRAEDEWMKKGSAIACQSTARRFHAKGMPLHKKQFVESDDIMPLTFPHNPDKDGKGRIHITNGWVSITGSKGIAFRVKKPSAIPQDFKSVTLRRTKYGSWESVWYRKMPIVLTPANKSDAAGIDFGLAPTATVTNPAFDLDLEKSCKAEETRAMKLLGKLKKLLKESDDESAKQRLQFQCDLAFDDWRAKQDRVIKAWARNMLLNFETIYVDDAFMGSWTNFGKYLGKAAKARPGQARDVLIKQAALFDRSDALVPVRSTNTTKQCSNCDFIGRDRKITEREFVCEKCGHASSRDRNSAWVILRKGMKEPKRQWGKDRRREVREERSKHILWLKKELGLTNEAARKVARKFIG
jgi:putative transposase